jgi:hypothetical protein
MIQYDLTDTPLAQRAERVEVPSEAELTAITVALALATGCGLRDLAHRELVLSDENISSVARILSGELAGLLCDLRANCSIEARLSELRGLRVGNIEVRRRP